MLYTSELFYVDEFLRGKQRKLPPEDFEFWVMQAQGYVDEYTFNSIKNNPDNLLNYKEEIERCACELAEYLYENEGYKNKKSETISDRSAAYKIGVEYYICQNNLLMTGLMYRGSNR